MCFAQFINNYIFPRTGLAKLRKRTIIFIIYRSVVHVENILKINRTFTEFSLDKESISISKFKLEKYKRQSNFKLKYLILQKEKIYIYLFIYLLERNALKM